MCREWYVYIIRCGDGSLYTGIAKDVERRVAEHISGKGARYTRGRGPLSLVDQVGPMTRSEALRLERRVKKVRDPSKKRRTLRDEQASIVAHQG